jgi:hypothetical protein
MYGTLKLLSSKFAEKKLNMTINQCVVKSFGINNMPKSQKEKYEGKLKSQKF